MADDEEVQSTGPLPSTWRPAVLAIVVLAAGAVVAFFLIRVSYRSLQGLESDVAVAIVSALAAAVVVIVGAVVNGYLSRRQQAERSQQEKRVPVYESFTKDFLDLMGATRAPADREEFTEADVYRVLGPFTESVLVWGSDDVVKQWVNFRQEGAASGPDGSVENLYRMEDLFLAMRRDLGLSNKKLDRGDLLRLFVTDLPKGKLGPQ